MLALMAFPSDSFQAPQLGSANLGPFGHLARRLREPA